MTLIEKLNDKIEINYSLINDDIENDYKQGMNYGIKFATDEFKKIIEENKNYDENYYIKKELRNLLERHQKVLESENISELMKSTIILIDNEIQNILER